MLTPLSVGSVDRDSPSRFFGSRNQTSFRFKLADRLLPVSKRLSTSRNRQWNRSDNLHHTLGLVLTSTSSPQGEERGDRFVSALPLLLGVVIKVQGLTLVPAVLIDLLLPESSSSIPLLRGLLAGRRMLSLSGISFPGDGEWSQVELVL